MGFLLAMVGVRAVFASRVGAVLVLALLAVALVASFLVGGHSIGMVKVWSIVLCLFALRALKKGRG